MIFVRQHLKQDQNLINHSFIHISEKRFECEFCYMKFRFKANLNRHLQKERAMQTGVKLFKCDKCYRLYWTSGELNDHTKRSHPKGGPYQCTKCETKLITRKSLKLHLQTHDKRECQKEERVIKEKTIKENFIKENKPNSCVSCLKAFPSKKIFLIHLLKHNSAKNPGADASGEFTCEQCLKVFNAKGFLRQHLLTQA